MVMYVCFCVRASSDQLRVQVLENYCLLATRNKNNVDRAMQSFVDMLEEDQDYLPAVLGMATGFMIEKNQVPAHACLSAWLSINGYTCVDPSISNQYPSVILFYVPRCFTGRIRAQLLRCV